MNISGSSRSSNITKEVLILAAWFGLVTGLLEGIGWLVFQELDWLFWRMSIKPTSLEIVWIAGFSNFLFFGVLGLALSRILKFFPQLPAPMFPSFIFVFLMLFDWLGLAFTKHIRFYSVLALSVGLAINFSYWFHKHKVVVSGFWRKSLPWVAGAALLSFVGIQGSYWLRESIAIAKLPTALPGSPNVLVIVVDTLRADHLSCYGYLRLTSPNTDRIARQGVLFEKAFATSSWTLPSHASLLTGRYVHEHGLTFNNPKAFINGRYATLAETLRSRGYRTGAFSANQLFFTRKFGFDRGFIRFEDYFHSVGDMFLRTFYGRMFGLSVLYPLGVEETFPRKRASDINRSLMRWIDRDREMPFFAFLNYFDPHASYLPPQPYRSQFSKLKNPGGIIKAWVPHPPQMTGEQLQGEVDAYDGAIAYVDDHIGWLITELQNRGLAKNTLIVITSDHGESFAEHGLFGHFNNLYREEIHVPLILWQPGQVPAGIRISRPVTNAALPSTIMDLMGENTQTLFLRPSLAQLWKDPQAYPNPSYPLIELERNPWTSRNAPAYHGPMKSLVSSKWQYIEHEKLGTELYDWDNDPKEKYNLASSPEGRRVIDGLKEQLQKMVGIAPLQK